ncbi:MAG: SDR family oxidoreductase [Gammaproteobacteria bacterium]|nr:SDR family oxidoreductase [Gammaproteobacteria bacterium]
MKKNRFIEEPAYAKKDEEHTERSTGATKSFEAEARLSKKSIVITGASRGIGLAISEMLTADQYQQSLIATNISSFKNKKNNIYYIGADFGSFEQIDAAAQELMSKLGHIDVLINNLGMYTGKTLLDTEKTDIQRLMMINFSGPAYFTHALLPLLKKAPHPQIINFSSIAVKNPLAGMSAYAASKAAVTGFSESLRAELNPEGVRVTVLHLSGVNTWNAPDPKGLLHPNDVAKTVKFVIDADPACQLNEITLSAVS